MSGLNLFKRDTNKPRITFRERFRNAAARVMPRSRGSHPGGIDASRRALVSGAAASAVVIPFPAAAAHSDAALIGAWGKFREAQAHNRTFNEQIEPLVRAALASLPEHPFETAQAAGKHPAGMTFQDLSEAQQIAYEEIRNEQYVGAWDSHGVTQLQNEQERFLEEVMWPLAETIRNTAPTTLEGAAIKARYLLENETSPVLRAADIKDLDLSDAALRLLIEQLAALA